MFISCNDKMEVDEIEINKVQRIEYSEHDKNVDYRATALINRQDLGIKELFDLYKELSDIGDETVKLNSKNLVLYYLESKNFINEANLIDIEYLIVDQKNLKSNIPTISINYKMFHRAIDLNSNLDLKMIENSFSSKNRKIIESFYNESDSKFIKFELAGITFRSRLSTIKN